ncbi:Laccase-1 [Verticillium dahliae VDG2]|nr:Laccase-1 [Verticillium dahliae VDG2]
MVSLVTSFTSLGPSALAYCVASSAIHVVGSVFFDLVHWLAYRSGRRITVTGARGALGHALADALGREKGASVPSSSLLRPEVWYVGSEAELHGAWTEDMRAHTSSKRAFARFARAYCDDDDFTYRHVVPAAFSSAMGPALVALWWIRRGARYVPVPYTGLAFLNFFFDFVSGSSRRRWGSLSRWCELK